MGGIDQDGRIEHFQAQDESPSGGRAGGRQIANRSCVVHDASVFQHHDPIGHVQNAIVMGHHDHSSAAQLPQLFQHLDHDHSTFTVRYSRGLVCKDHIRVSDQCTSDRDAGDGARAS